MSAEKSLSASSQDLDGLEPLLNDLRCLVTQARDRALRAVDLIQVQTYWQVGHHLVEFEQAGAARAAYGKRLLSVVADRLTAEFGKGFDERNLRNMRAFFQRFPIWNALRTELSWTHYRILSRVQNDEARAWYMAEAAEQNWSSRVLERQIGTLFYERLLLSQDKASVAQEAKRNIAKLDATPRAFVRDPVMLEFLGLPASAKLLESILKMDLWISCRRFC